MLLTFKQTSSGQIFLLSLLLLSSILILAVILATIFTKSLHQATETPESVKAFYAADACMEWLIYQNISGVIQEKPEMLNNTSCEWVNELDTLGTMETIGISGTIRRGLEIWIGE
ncbi:MAG: hypothetical protein BWY48_00030 [Parcubacteria group bacterium ADurb.Bin305]|jgi:hypothetical protein|nr:hypothetical protein [Candidatus Paceibacterota bacterium]MDD3434329.1 hypothetical protein [Candidatus Paceibacterota bacterium]OQA44474.1 MAG: hypothetical protein BWY48_00030 [Parcubacteria group bacterium ADurb.Bin305]